MMTDDLDCMQIAMAIELHNRKLSGRVLPGMATAACKPIIFAFAQQMLSGARTLQHGNTRIIVSQIQPDHCPGGFMARFARPGRMHAAD